MCVYGRILHQKKICKFLVSKFENSLTEILKFGRRTYCRVITYHTQYIQKHIFRCHTIYKPFRRHFLHNFFSQNFKMMGRLKLRHNFCSLPITKIVLIVGLSLSCLLTVTVVYPRVENALDQHGWFIVVENIGFRSSYLTKVRWSDR